MAFRIRSLRLSDYPQMIELFEVCGLEPRILGRDSRREIARQLRSNRALYLGAFDGDRLVGTCLATHDTRKGWINRLAVHPDYRRRGLATRLVRACEAGLRRKGLEIFAALVAPENLPSHRLFVKLGYEATDIRYYRRKVRGGV